jgi:hypothetical protein
MLMSPVTNDHLAGDHHLVDVGRGRSEANLIWTGARGAHRI